MSSTKTKTREKVAEKPTPIRPGAWRNVWHSSSGWGRLHPTSTRVDRYTQLSGKRYPSRELAEEYAQKKMQLKFAEGGQWFGLEGIVSYRGARFFPEEPT